MEKNSIQFRPIVRADYDALEKIICDTWDYERFSSARAAKSLSRLNLASSLANQTYSCVAVSNGEPVGFILGKNEKTHRASPRHIMHLFISAITLLASRDGRYILKQFKGYNQINDELFSQNTHDFAGEVAFFVVRSDQRGTGVGKELFAGLQNYMKSQNISDYYLYTDSTCNYGFYEHHGLKRICEKKRRLKAYHNKEISFFMYGLSPSFGSESNI